MTIKKEGELRIFPMVAITLELGIILIYHTAIM